MLTTFQRITVGVDFSESSLAAFAWARNHLAPRATVELVHAVDLPHMPSFLKNAIPHFEQSLRNLRRGAEERLRDLTETTMTSSVVEGRGADALLERAKATDSDLIVVGAEGRHRGLGKLVGSTPERLLEQSDRPIVVVRGPQDAPPRRILVALDGSTRIKRITTLARNLVGEHGVGVVALTVVPTWMIDRVRYHGKESDSQDMIASQKAAAREWLQTTVRENGLDLPETRVVVDVGAPGLEILRVARIWNVDLILMGVRDPSLGAPPFVGGCARYVLRNGQVPVLFVAGEPT